MPSTDYLNTKVVTPMPGISLLNRTNYWTTALQVRVSLLTDFNESSLYWSDISSYEVTGTAYSNQLVLNRSETSVGSEKRLFGDPTIFESYEYIVSLPRYAVIWEDSGIPSTSTLFAVLDFGSLGVQLSFRQLTIYPFWCPLNDIYFYSNVGTAQVGRHTVNTSKTTNKYGRTT